MATFGGIFPESQYIASLAKGESEGKSNSPRKDGSWLRVPSIPVAGSPLSKVTVYNSTFARDRRIRPSSRKPFSRPSTSGVSVKQSFGNVNNDSGLSKFLTDDQLRSMHQLDQRILGAAEKLSTALSPRPPTSRACCSRHGEAGHVHGAHANGGGQGARNSPRVLFKLTVDASTGMDDDITADDLQGGGGRGGGGRAGGCGGGGGGNQYAEGGAEEGADRNERLWALLLENPEGLQKFLQDHPELVDMSTLQIIAKKDLYKVSERATESH
jgi:hypothetical protein